MSMVLCPVCKQAQLNEDLLKVHLIMDHKKTVGEVNGSGIKDIQKAAEDLLATLATSGDEFSIR